MADASNQGRFNIEELENAAAFTVGELERFAEALRDTAGLQVTLHSPEAAWSDPVQIQENLRGGALLSIISYPEGRTALLLSLEDAAFLTAALMGLPPEEIQAKVKAGMEESDTDILAGVLHRTFESGGGTVENVSLHTSAKQAANVVENEFGVSFLTVKTSATPSGYSDFTVIRIFGSDYAETFSARPGTSAFDTMAVPAADLTGPFGDDTATAAEAATGPGTASPRSNEILLQIPVTARVVVAAKTMRLKQLLDLLPGTVMEFERKANEPLALAVNGHTVAEGEAVRAGRKFGIRITSVKPVENRVHSLKG